jgi:ribulose bisphosphate carboxylase small subunit
VLVCGGVSKGDGWKVEFEVKRKNKARTGFWTNGADLVLFLSSHQIVTLFHVANKIPCRKF